MISTHWFMDRELKQEFKQVIEILTERQKTMSFTTSTPLKNNSFSQTLKPIKADIAIHYQMIEAMLAINELSWLANRRNLLQFQVIPELRNLTSNIHQLLLNADNPSLALNIINHARVVTGSIETFDRHAPVSACFELAYNAFVAASLLTTAVFGLLLIAGSTSIGLSALPTLAVGSAMLLVGIAFLPVVMSETTTYGRLATGKQVSALEKLSESLEAKYDDTPEVVATLD